MPEKIHYKLRDLMKNVGIMVSLGINNNSPMHSHDCLQICYVVDGHADQQLGDKLVKISKGDYFVVDIGEGHMYSNVSQNFPQLCVRFLPSLMWTGFSDDLKADELTMALCADDKEKSGVESIVGKVFHDKNGVILRRVRNIRKEWEKRLPGWRRIAAGELAAILMTMARTVEPFRSHKSSTSFVNSITRYVEDHYYEPIQLDQLCKMCNYTMSYVSRVFRETTGKSFSEYLMYVRVEKACAMLSSTNKSVGKIAKAVGYSNTSFFFRLFKNCTGMTPREWRSLHKNDNESENNKT